jgi:hypothetical protein
MKLRLQWACLTLLGIGCLATASWAGTVLRPGALLAKPESYQSQIVRVTGIVANHKLRRTGAHKCIQYFTMKDETAAITAVHGASCAGVKNALRNRDIVTVEALFDWAPGKSASLKVHSILSKVAPSAQ